MARELAAAALMALLFTGALLNARHMDRITHALEAELLAAREQAESGDTDAAGERVLACLEAWLRQRDYAYAVMRHEDTDGVTDGFYDLLEALPQEDGEAAQACFGRLLYRLSIIGEREHISLASVL